ncbi:hypothetical protein B0H10DRAFT_662811 [Mycena sp. CBHHK59/15]|nr:hypothetical protein B0H10DRAFT_662811 [Mycena sp. CBHHK59/15]
MATVVFLVQPEVHMAHSNWNQVEANLEADDCLQGSRLDSAGNLHAPILMSGGKKITSTNRASRARAVLPVLTPCSLPPPARYPQFQAIPPPLAEVLLEAWLSALGLPRRWPRCSARRGTQHTGRAGRALVPPARNCTHTPPRTSTSAGN